MMITRRQILKTAAAGGAVGALASISNASLALAGMPTDKRLVVIILRGGADGLALVPAPGDPDFATLRRQLAQQSQSKQDFSLDGFFGLHPDFNASAKLWRQKQLTVVHAVQTSYRGRSHFDAQDMLENGLNNVSALADGWLNRALKFYGGKKPRTGLAVGYGTPLILRGKTEIATWAPRQLPRPKDDYLQKLLAISNDDQEIGRALADGIETDRVNRKLLGDLELSYRGRQSRLGAADLAEAAGRLLSADLGARIATLDIGGWDSHGSQNIYLSYRVPALDTALTSLKTGLGEAWAKTVVVVVSEFGRTAAPNGTNGTDHGTAGAMLLAGGAVRGGRVLTDWPGLKPAKLFQGRDLMPTTDARAVFKGIVIDHLGIDEAFVESHVFPNSGQIRALQNLVVTS